MADNVDIHDVLTVGNTLTVDHDVINDCGEIVLSSGQKVRIIEVDITPSKWSNCFNMFMPERINWIVLENIYGLWFPSVFTETKNYT